ncbi:UDP-N-acetylmuramoyl-tripeptide--D-alanyl-D-alanine ligase [bacterium]|nr:UDP-N-acetylmuramoyl-tripeptide--D-alanyl-D-alanine ligase [bacterium]
MFSHLLLERVATQCGANWNSNRPALISSVSIDSRTAIRDTLFIAFKGEFRDGHDFIPELLAKGVFCVGEVATYDDANYIKVPSSLDFLQQLSRERLRLKGELTIIAVSGSSGKTTTRELIVSGLRLYGKIVHSTTGNLNNHLGLPLTILALPLIVDIAVLEMGMNHTGEIALLTEIATPDIGVLTNIGFAHIGNFSSRDELALAKLELFEGSKSVLYRSDDKWMRQWAERSDRESTSFEMPTSFAGKLENLPHFMAENTLTAFNTIKMVVPTAKLDEIIEKSKAKKLPKYRGEMVVKGEQNFVMDCYNANPDSMKKSIDSFIKIYGRTNQPLYLVLGEMGELGNFSKYFHQELVMYIKSLKVLSRVFLTGKEFEKLRGVILECRNVEFIPSLADLRALLPKHGFFLLKGSRANALERLVEQKELSE